MMMARTTRSLAVAAAAVAKARVATITTRVMMQLTMIQQRLTRVKKRKHAHRVSTVNLASRASAMTVTATAMAKHAMNVMVRNLHRLHSMRKATLSCRPPVARANARNASAANVVAVVVAVVAATVTATVMVASRS